MKFNRNIHHRRSIRLRGYDYSQSGAYFITICTFQRKSLFGDITDGKMYLNAAGEVVDESWLELPVRYPGITPGEHVVMPNHFHGILHISVGAQQAAPQVVVNHNRGAASSAPTLGKIIRRFKSVSAIAVNRCLNRTGQPVWQRNYHEHIIRNEQAYQCLAEYIRTNPQTWRDDIYRVNE